jgi:hypothetical protein
MAPREYFQIVKIPSGRLAILSCQRTVGRRFEHLAARKNRRRFEIACGRVKLDGSLQGKTGKWLIAQVIRQEKIFTTLVNDLETVVTLQQTYLAEALAV